MKKFARGLYPVIFVLAIVYFGTGAKYPQVIQSVYLLLSLSFGLQYVDQKRNKDK